MLAWLGRCRRRRRRRRRRWHKRLRRCVVFSGTRCPIGCKLRFIYLDKTGPTLSIDNPICALYLFSYQKITFNENFRVAFIKVIYKNPSNKYSTPLNNNLALYVIA